MQMGRLKVEISMVDNDGRERLAASRDEVTRLDVDRDPLYVFGRLQALVESAVDELHRQALQVGQPAPAAPAARELQHDDALDRLIDDVEAEGDVELAGRLARMRADLGLDRG